MKPRIRPHPHLLGWWVCGLGRYDQTMARTAIEAGKLWDAYWMRR